MECRFAYHSQNGQESYKSTYHVAEKVNEWKPNSISLAGRELVADLRDMRERVTDKSKACLEPVRKLYVADVTSDVCDLTCIDMTGWVESVPDLSRHVEIDQHAFDQVFDTKSSELIVSRSQTRYSRTKAFDLLDWWNLAFSRLQAFYLKFPLCKRPLTSSETHKCCNKADRASKTVINHQISM